MIKSKGFTLMEVIAVIAILSILLAFGTSSTKYYSKISRDIETEEFIASFENLLSLSKVEAINRDSILYLRIENTTKKIKLEHNSRVIESMKIPGYINNYGKARISITSDGQLDSETLIFENLEDRERYYFKIRVGVDFVNFEKKNF
ncbi:MAG: pilus assembly FimT family protein [Clostridium sp.]|uniref:pilus assembly FimT family protein n=1 Tax=Clostridium sp. TaxID=1506 RepID=UPI003F3FD4F0